MINGANPDMLPPIAFVDFDGVIVHDSTHDLIPGAAEAMRKLARTHRIILFTSRRPELFEPALSQVGVKIHGHIAKPMACNYLYVDDRLQVENCANSLEDCVKHDLTPRSTGPWLSSK